MPARVTKLLRSYSFRLAALYIVLFGVSVLVLFGVIYWAITSYMTNEQDLAVEAELSALTDMYAAGGLDDLATSVTEQTRPPNHARNFELLQGKDGKPIAGNLPAMAAKPGWQNFTLTPPADVQADGDGENVRAKGMLLPSGDFLLVGEGDQQLHETQEFVVRAFGWAGAMTLILSLAGGIVMSAGLLRRVDAVRRTTEDIMEGNLSRRVPTTGSGDDFDLLAASLNAMLDRIEQLMERVRQVSNDIAHDLRTPLTRLHQRLEHARTHVNTVEEFLALVDSNIEETNQILATFGAMLRIAQIESGSARQRFSPVDLSALIRAIAELYLAYAEDQAKTIVSAIEPGITVQGDKELLTQMLVNLIENALRHTPAGTRIELSLARQGGAVVCTIADNGPGIPPEEFDKVFRRFYRLDASRATPGSGLGLALVAAVAALHRIRIELSDNRPGLRVTLRL